MATISWLSGVSGLWTDPTKWSPATVPGPSDDAVIAATGGYTVSLTSSVTVASLTISDSNATLAASGTGTLLSVTGTVANSGTLQFQNGAVLTTSGGLSNTGALSVNNGGSGFSSLAIGGTLTNSNFIQIGDSSSPTTVTTQALANTGRIDLDGGNTGQVVLSVAAAAPTTWTGTVNLSGESLLEFAGTSSITAISSSAAINLSGVQAFVAAAGINTTSNSALTGLTSNAGQLQLQSGASLTTTAGLTNSGGLYVNNGGLGAASLTIGGTLTNSNLVQLGDGGLATTVSVQNLSNTGQLSLQGGSGATLVVLNVAAAAPTTWTGTANLSGAALLAFAGSTGITAIGTNSAINLSSAQAFVAAAGSNTTSNSALTTLASNAGQLQLQSGASITTTVSLNNTGQLLINNGGTGGASLTIGGTLTNSNYVQIGNGALATTITAQNLANTGRIDIDGGTTAQATLDITAAAPSTWTGTVNISGMGLLEFGGSSGITAIGTNAQINLSGPHAFIAASGVNTTSNSALTGLTTNAGQLQLQSGASLMTTGSLSNSGDLYVDNGGSGGSNLTIGGTLTNSNSVQIGNGNVAGSVTAQVLSNTGQIAILGGTTNQALLNVTVMTAPAIWSGTVSLSGDALLEFAGTAGINSIASGAQISISGAHADVAAAGLGTTGNTALTGLTSIAGDLELQGSVALALSGALAVTGSLNIDTRNGSFASNVSLGGDLSNSGSVSIGSGNDSGGSTVSISGALNNSGTFNVSADQAATPTAVTAATLDNTGALNISGTRGGQAVLDITGQAAPPLLTSAISLNGDALLEFASGTITTIRSGGQLNISGVQALVANATDPTHDSALAGLTTVAGEFGVDFDASLALSGGLNVTGTLNVDSQVPSDSTGATLTIAGNLTNSGAVNVDNGAGAGGGTLTIAGTLTNTNTLTIGTGYGSGPTASTLVSAAGLSNSGTIDIIGNTTADTTNQATLDIGSAAPSTLTSIINLTGDSLLEFASGGITSIGSGGQLNVMGTESRVADASDTTHNSALTGVTNIAGEFGVDFGASVALSGGLNVTGTLNVDSQVPSDSTGATLTIAGNLTNSGAVNVDNGAGAGGGTLTIAGTLTNTNTLTIGTGYGSGPTASTLVSAAGLSNSGTIDIIGNTTADTTNQATLDIGSAAPSTLTSIINLTGDSLLEFASGGITSIGSGGQLNVMGTESRVADASDTTHNSALTGVTNIAGEFGVDFGASVALSGGLNVTGTLNVDSQVPSDSTGATLTIAGNLTNSGAVNVDNGAGAGGGTLTIAGTLTNTNTLTIGTGYGSGPTASTLVSAAGLSNSGTIDIIGNTTADTTNQATLDIGSAAPSTLSGTVELSGDSLLEFASGAAPSTLNGTVELSGDSLLEFATGSFTSIAASGELIVNGTKAFIADASDLTHNSALAGLQSVAGNLTLQGGTTVNTTGPLAISGSLSLQGSSLTTAGAVTVSGSGATVNIDSTSTLSVTVGNSFTQTGGSTTVSGALSASLIDVAGGKFDEANSITGQAFEVGGDGLLEFGGGVDAASTVTFTDGTGTIQLDKPESFVATVDGAQVGDVFHLVNTAVTGLSYANGALTVSGSGGAVATLNLSGSYTTSDFGFLSDGSGGSYVVVELPAPPTLWTNASGGSWTTAADWATGATPTSATDVLIGGVPGNYTVSLAGTGTTGAAHSITIDDNNARLEIDPGASLAIGQNVSNAGSFVLEGGPPPVPGANVTVAGSFLNTGYLAVDDGSFGIGGSTLTIQGTLTGSGSVQVGGDYRGGIGTGAPATLITQGLDSTGSILVEGNPGAQATLEVTAGAAPSTLASSIDVRGTALLEYASGGITAVAASGSLTVGGTNSFIADSGQTSSDSAIAGLSSNAGHVEFDTGSTLTITPADGTFTNSGSFVLEGGPPPVPGANVTVAGSFLNTGYLAVDDGSFGIGGSTLTIQGTLTGSGSVQVGGDYRGGIGTGAPATLITQGLDSTGSILVEGNPGAQATLEVTAGAAPSTLASSIDVRGTALLEYASGGITAVAASGSLTVGGTNSFIADSGQTSSDSAIAGLSSNAGHVEFDTGSTLTITPADGTFTNSGSFVLEGGPPPVPGANVTVAGSFLNTGYLAVDDGSFGIGGSTLTIQGTLTGSGSVQVGGDYRGGIGTGAPATLITQGLDSTGSILVEGNPGAQATLDVTAAPTTLYGSIYLRGTSLMEFDSGSITSIAAGASLRLEGPNVFVADSSNTAANGGLSGLTSNAGTLTLLDSPLPLTGDLDNTGTLNFDTDDGAGGSTVSIAGTLTDSGKLLIGNSDLSAATTVTAGGLNEQGTLTLTGSANARATLNVTGAAQSTLTTSITLTRNALLEFGSGSINTIAASGSLTLDGGASVVADSNNLNASGALSGLASLQGTLSLLDGAAVSITGGLANAGALQVDAASNSIGASSLNVAGTLDNAAILTIGNGNLGATSTVTAGAFINEAGATITLSAGANGANAGLTVKTTLTNDGNFQLQPGGFVEAGSLDNAGILGLTGNAAAPTDLGVIGNATNEGAITVGSFAELGVTGNFTDSGNIALAGTLDVANSLTVTSTGSILLQGGSIIDPSGGQLVIASGTALVGNGSIGVPVENDGTISPSGGLLDIGGPITGTGQLNLGGPAAELELGGPSAEAMSFGGNVGTMKFDAPASVTGPIHGIVKGDAIDLADIQATSAVVNGSTLTVTAGTQTLDYQVSGAGLTGNVFAIESDGHGGTNLVLGPPGPVIDGPTTQTVFTGLPAVLGPLSIADPAAGNGALTVTVSDTSGTLSADGAGAGIVGGDSTNTLTLTGDLTDINTMLASLTYVGASAGSDTVVVQVTDADNLTTAQSIALTTENVPFTEPTINVPGSETVILGTSTALGNISLADPYAEITGQELALSLAFPGSLSASGGPGGTVSGEGTDVLQVSGTVAQINSYFADSVEGGTTQAAPGPAINTLVRWIGIADTILSDNFLLRTVLRQALLAAQQGSVATAQAILADAGLTGLAGRLVSSFFVADIFITALIGAANRAGGGSGGGGGGGSAVQFTTFNGTAYKLDAGGEFILAASTQPGDTFQLQIRLQPFNGSASASAITQIAALVGSDRVTFGVLGNGRTDPVIVDGNPVTPTENNPIALSGGQLTKLSGGTYEIAWNTGETLTVTDYGSYLDFKVGLPSGEAPGSIAGLMGPNGGAQADTFELPNGTVLQQPLTTNELYQTFAQAWLVPQGFSLFDYGPGQSSATFDNASFPSAQITVADLPTNVVAAAAAVVAAAGITDPNAAAAAEFDYLASGGDLGVVESDASLFQGVTTTAANITPSGPAPAVLGVIPNAPSVAESQTGSTSVTFDVYLTAAESSPTQVDYTVIAPNSIDLGASAFGGTLPSSEITLAAGTTSGSFQIDVPQGALGSLASVDLAVQISTPSGVPIFAPDGQAVLLAPQPGTPPVPQLVDLTNFGNFSQSGNNYTLDLGAVQLGETLPPLQFAIENAANAPSDQLTGTFSIPTVAGFSYSGASIPSPIAAGQSYNGLSVTVNQDKFGTNSEVITFNPIDTNASGFSAPLTPITLTIADTLELPGMIYSQAFGDVHIITYNGLEYDFQASGEFVLAQSRIPGDNFQIQMQLAPWYSGASVTTIHEVAIALGSDDVTFDWTRANTVLVDGAAPASLSVGTPLTLAGGTITEVTPDMYKVAWNTGETMTVTNVTPFYPGFPDYISIVDGVAGNVGPGAYAGLQGEDEGTQNDIQLADGQVLPQPVSSAELYGEYANSWAVSAATSLFGTPVMPVSPPADPVTLADLPQNLVNQAAALVAAAGITDPGIAQAAELDYLATGDPSFITAAANIQQQVVATTPATVMTPTPAVAVGVAANATSVTEATSGKTPVTFTAYLTGAEATDTEVDYQVLSPGAGFLSATAFGGTLPSGNVTIAAGQTTAQFTIAVPQGALGTDPNDKLEVQVSNPLGLPVFAPTAQTEIANNQPEPGNLAQPVLAEIGGDGTLSFNAATNTYTLVLGSLTAGSALQAVQLAVVNAAIFPADSLGGSFTPPTGTGFIITGNDLPSPLAPEQTYQGLYVSVNAFATGANTMTMMFDPTDINDSGYSAALTPITLDITDSVVPAAVPRINTPTTIVFPNVHVGSTADSQHVSVTNTATAGAANLDVTLTASGNAIASGSITGLAPGATDATDLTVGINTSSAGPLSGGVTENFVSDLGGGNTSRIAEADPYIDVFGGVYRLAGYTVQPNNLVVHIGDSGTQTLTITDTDPNDGYSENLIATVIGVTGGVTASGTTGDIDPQSTGALTLKFSTATAGPVGTVTLDLKSDGTGIDGLGITDLGDVTVPVSVSANTIAAAATIEELSGGGTFSQHGSVYTLNLGTITGSASVNLGVLNSATAPADTLGGSFTITGDSAFTNSGFTTFSGIASGAADTAPTVTLTPTFTGTYSETITLTPLDAAGGGNLPLSPETLTITADYVPQLVGQVSLTAATEGTALLASTTIASFTDTNTNDTAGTFTASINWGDGTTAPATVTGTNGSFTVTGGHTYADEGSDPLSLTITDTANSATLPLTGTVAVAEGDVFTPNGVAFTINPNQLFSGTVATFTDIDTVNVASDFTATINWGDGSSPTTGVITDVAGDITVTGSHTYADVGQDVVTVTLADDAPGTAAADAISAANVTEATGQLSGQLTLTSATEGIALASTTTVATFTDSNTSEAASGFTATINWGDGTTTTGTLTGGDGAFVVNGGHTYADEGQDTATVTITRTADSTQIAPSGTVVVAEGDAFTPQGVTFKASPGAVFSRTVATFTDIDTVNVASDFTATINWGDGTPTTAGVITDVAGAITVNGTHTYAATGEDAVTVTLADNAPGTATATADSTADVGLQLAGQVTLTSATEGIALTSQTVATFTDTNTSDTASTFTATINWGDGSTSSGTVSGSAGTYNVSGSHSYADEGSDTLSVTVTDTANSVQLPLNGTVVVAEGDAFTPQGVTFKASPGAVFSGTVATFTDIDTVNVASDFTATINWGDGTPTTAGVITDVAGAITVNGTHTYAATGEDAVTVTLADNAPGTATATADSTADVGLQLAGQVTLTSATEGIALTSQTVATFTDTNASDTASTFSASINWGDGTPTTTGVITGSDGTFSVAGSHSYADEGSDTLSVTVTDTANSVQLPLNGTVVVAEGDAFTPQGVTFKASPGAAFSGTVATFTDIDTVNVASDFTATINWGDGTPTTAGVITDVAGAITVNGTHTYAATGEDAVTVTLADNAPGTATATADSTADVGLQLAGQVTLTSATEGIALTSQTVATFTDTNTSDTASTFTATINWGDGSTSSGTVSGSAGTYNVLGSHSYADEGSDALSVTVTDTANSVQLPLNGTVVVAEGDAFTPQGVTFKASPGAAFSGTVATFTDIDTVNVASDFTATINWGDGTPTTAGVITDVAGAITVNGTHTYAATGEDAVTVTLADNAPGTATATADSTADVGLQLAGQVTLTSATEGIALTSQTVATFTDTNTSDTASTFTATINWGDGSTSSGTVSGSAGTYNVSGSHNYADEASDTLSVTVTDTANSVQLPLNGTVVVAEGDAFTPQGVTFKASPGAVFSGTVATFTDTDTVNVASDFTATINWGDGTPTTAGVITDVAGAITVNGTHTYAATGEDAVTVTLADNAPGTATATADSTADVGLQLAGQVTLTSATEGIALTSQTVATFTDTNTSDTASTFTATINWGDGSTSSGTVSGSAGTYNVSGSHNYADEASDTLSVTVTDTANSVQLPLNGTVVVAEGDAFTPQGVTFQASPGAVFSGTVATFTDIDTVNVASDFTATINWGDGTPTTAGVITDVAGAITVNGTHTYAATGQDTVTVKLSDDAPGTATATADSTADVSSTTSAAVTINPVDGNNVINNAEAHAAGGVPVTGTETGLASGATFTVTVTDGTFSKGYTATVGANGSWATTIPSAGAVMLANGTATVTAQVNTAQASENVTVAETLPTVTINKINGDDIININNNKVICGGDDDDDHKGDYKERQGSSFQGWQQDQQTTSQGGGWRLSGPQGYGDGNHNDNDNQGSSCQLGGRQDQRSSSQGGGDWRRSGDWQRSGDCNDDNQQQQDQGVSAVTLTGTVSGIAANSTFLVMVSDGSFSKSYTATVNAAGTDWTATLPASDVADLPAGTATVTAQVTDQYGNTSLPAVQLVTVEGVTPTVLSVAASPSTGDFDACKTITITLTMSEAVNVTGCPSLTLNDCGTATFDQANSTATALVFDYTVAPGQNTSDLKITGVDLSGDASIKDLAGDNANLSGAAVNLGLVIDTIAPTVCNVVASPDRGNVTTGHTVAVTLDMSEPVAVTGSPSLVLNDGGLATYDTAHSTSTALTFDYTVAKGQTTSDLKVIGIELPSSSSIADLAGNTANLSGAAANLQLGINTKKSTASGPSSGNLSVNGTTGLELFGASSAAVTFASGAAAELKLDSSSQFTGQISGFRGQNEIDLADISFGAHTTLGYSSNHSNTGGTLTVGDGAETARLALLGQYVAGSFATSSDGHGGTIIADPAIVVQNQLTQPHA